MFEYYSLNEKDQDLLKKHGCELFQLETGDFRVDFPEHLVHYSVNTDGYKDVVLLPKNNRYRFDDFYKPTPDYGMLLKYTAHSLPDSEKKRLIQEAIDLEPRVQTEVFDAIANPSPEEKWMDEFNNFYLHFKMVVSDLVGYGTKIPRLTTSYHYSVILDEVTRRGYELFK